MPSESEIRQEALRLVQAVEAREGLRRFIYKGKCMSPVLLDEDLLLVKPAAAAELRLGDILVYRAGGQFWVHRFLCRKSVPGKNFLIVSKPDNAMKPDEPFPETDLVGIVHESRRNKRSLDFTKGPVRGASRILGVLSLLESASYSAAGKIPLPPSMKKFLGFFLKALKPAFARLLTGMRGVDK